MVFISTLETECFTAFTDYSVFHCKVRFLNQVLAFLGWAPLNILILIGKLLTVPLVIFLQIIYFLISRLVLHQESFVNRMRNNHVASQLRACAENAHRSIFSYFILKEVFPAGFTELMAAR